jgi:hypothetical protein
MATYEEIYGKRVKEFDSDPTLDSSYEGQVWYDKSSGTLRSVVAFDSFTSAAPILTSRSNIAGMGTQTAALAAAGSVPPYSAACELYNGTGWTNTTSNNTARQTASSSGTSTAGLIAGGQSSPGQPGYTNASEEFDGSSWTEGDNLNMTRAGLCGFGTQTAGVAAGGYGPPPSGTAQNATEEYDGTSWTAQNTFTTGAEALAGAGTQTAGLVFGGASPPNTARTAEYDGTNWTTVGSLNTARHALAGDGVQTSAIAIGGNTGSYTGAAEKYDGTSWTTSPATLGTSRANLAASHTSSNNSSAVVFGGQSPSVTTATEEFNASINTITAAAWSSGALMGAGRYQGNGQNVGTQTAGMYAGGRGSFPATQPAVTVSSVEEYDGSSWSEVNNMPTSLDMFGSVGTQTAAFVFGGMGGPGAGPNPAPGGSTKDGTYNYDGTNWTSETALPAATQNLTGAGTQTAVVSIGGNPALTTCNEYDGSSWTSTGSMTTGRRNGSAFGLQTAAIIAGGNPGSAVAEDVESYNGSSWTSASDLIQAKAQAGTAGTQTDGLIFAGNEPSPTIALGWNGTSWFTQPSISTARYGGSNGSTSVASAYYAGGGGSASGTQRQTTEEFTAETSTVTAKTLTSS